MALVSANQFQLTPDIAGAVSKGLGAFQAVKAGQAREQQLGFQQQQLGLQQQKADQELLQQQAKGVFNAAVEIDNLPTNEAKVNATEARFQQLSSEGKDTSDTRALLDLYRSGNFEEADALLKSTVQTGIQTGFLKAPAQQKAPAKFEQTKGGLVFDPNKGTFAIDPVAKQRFDELAVKATTEGKLDFKDRQSLNKDVTGLLKNTVMINNTAKDLDKLGKVNSGPASIALVFKFMKALDPTSVVREGEFATAENSAGVPESVGNIYNKLINGERLGDVQIKQFIETAKQLSNTAATASENEVGRMLETFGNTIPDKFKSNLLGRIPKQFEVTATTDTGSDKSIFTATPLAVEAGQEAKAPVVQQTQDGQPVKPTVDIQVNPSTQALLDKYLGVQ